MPETRLLSSKIVQYLEGVRLAEELTFADFVTHFDITIQSYHRWRKAVREGKEPQIRLSVVQKGLTSLGYDAYVIISKSEKE